MPAEFGIVYPLWNEVLAPRDLLERVAGEVGLDHITVPVITGPWHEFRLVTPLEPERSFATEGGWHFPPVSERYRPTGVIPRTARWTGKRNHLARLCERAGALSLRLVFRVDLRGAACASEQHAHLRMRDAWDDELPWACVAQAELRELLYAVLADLACYEPAGIELADWALDTSTGQAHETSLSWHAGARRLANTCFCPACRQVAAHAGLDADHIARSVRVHTERMLTHPEDDWRGMLAADELLKAYRHGVRPRECADWLTQLSASHPQERQYLLRPVTANGDCTPAGWYPLLDTPAGTTHEELERGILNRTERWEETPTVWGLSLPVWRPTFTDSAALVRMVTQTAAAARLFDLDGVSTALPEAITWLKQAVRFARRG
ncbi:MAG: hypothetical protein JXO22_05765 [Phycisphaerae bacterium]|nr:hypothetical protein [Phycisphaerae bacterium]